MAEYLRHQLPIAQSSGEGEGGEGADLVEVEGGAVREGLEDKESHEGKGNYACIHVLNW